MATELLAVLRQLTDSVATRNNVTLFADLLARLGRPPVPPTSQVSAQSDIVAPACVVVGIVAVFAQLLSRLLLASHDGVSILCLVSRATTAIAFDFTIRLLYFQCTIVFCCGISSLALLLAIQVLLNCT